MLEDLAEKIVEVYGRADDAVEHFKLVSGIACPAGCVLCCHSKKVEATVAEMVPLAFHLFATQQAELLLKRLENTDHSEPCILFRPDLREEFGGGCSQYPFRALVCRLFGFAGRMDQYGREQFRLCRHMASSYSTIEVEGNMSKLPLFQEFGVAITSLHPYLGTERMNINHALYQALSKVGLHLALQEQKRADEKPEPPEATPFDRPPVPRERAA